MTNNENQSVFPLKILNPTSVFDPLDDDLEMEDIETSSQLMDRPFDPTKIDIANIILRMFNKPELTTKLSFEELHMAPGHIIVVEPSPVPSHILQTLPIEKNE